MLLYSLYMFKLDGNEFLNEKIVCIFFVWFEFGWLVVWYLWFWELEGWNSK